MKNVVDVITITDESHCCTVDTVFYFTYNLSSDKPYDITRVEIALAAEDPVKYTGFIGANLIPYIINDDETCYPVNTELFVEGERKIISYNILLEPIPYMLDTENVSSTLSHVATYVMPHSWGSDIKITAVTVSSHVYDDIEWKQIPELVNICDIMCGYNTERREQALLDYSGNVWFVRDPYATNKIVESNIVLGQPNCTKSSRKQ